ncbi:MAG TPA: hypothetical protein PK986_11000, partial [Spirochaetota bacterium]|nr:hypothetical protein [Spirochaetota bacterium]
RAERITNAYSASDYALYDRVTALFQVVDQGSRELNVPVYNGGLFLTEPSGDDAAPEATSSSRSLNSLLYF